MSAGSGEISRWRGGAVERSHDRELAAIERRGEVVQAKIQSIGQATKTAVIEDATTANLIEQVMRIAPGAAPMYALHLLTQAVAEDQVISQLNRDR
jgi:hypothetical protein